MLTRALVVWVMAATAMLVLALYTQDMAFTAAALAAALLLAAPLALSTWLGALGDAEKLDWPNASFVTLAMWSGMMAPSFVVDNPDAHMVFDYSDDSVWIGRWIFFFWCLVVLLVRGRILPARLVIEPQVRDVLATLLPCALAVGYLLATGQFSDYDQGRNAPGGALEQGGVSIVAVTLARTEIVTPILLLVGLRASGARMRQIALVLFVLSWGLLFLHGGRRSMAHAAAGCFFVARVCGAQFRLSAVVAVASLLPLIFFLMFAYRSTLLTRGTPVESLSGYVDTAVDSTSSMVALGAQREEAAAVFATNTKERFWSGPQFFAVVDLWLEEGVEYHGTFVSGLVWSLPSWFFPDKLEWARPYGLEALLADTGRFPRTDLGPSAWLQWLFELGIPGIIIGAVLCGLIVKQVDARIVKTRSLPILMFWMGILAGTSAAELTADALVVCARSHASLLLCSYLLGLMLDRVLTGVVAGRRATAAEGPDVLAHAAPSLGLEKPPQV